jgi:hypothetical protein
MPHLVDLVLSGKKDSTFRLFDDKDLAVGDELTLINKETLSEFAKAMIVDIKEKKLGELEDVDFSGHEKFSSTEEMYKAYRLYYGDKVGPGTVVKIIKFKLYE